MSSSENERDMEEFLLRYPGWLFSQLLGIFIQAVFLLFERHLFIESNVIYYLLRPSQTTLTLCRHVNGPSSCRNTMCSHCWDDVQHDQRGLIHIKFNSGWHEQCLQDWIDSRSHSLEVCPICRDALTKAALIIQPDGLLGHIWRPAALLLMCTQLFVLCLLRSILAVSNKRVFSDQLGNMPCHMPVYLAVAFDILLAHSLTIRAKFRWARCTIFACMVVIGPLGRWLRYGAGIASAGFLYSAVSGSLMSLLLMYNSEAWLPNSNMAPFLH